MADENFDPYYTWLGIRPEEQPPDHYRLIGLRQFEENADVIANAADRQMQFLRSMQVGKRSALSQKLLNEISAAGGCLLDPQRKTAYDKELRAKEAAKTQAARAAAPKLKPPRAAALEPISKPDLLTATLPAPDLFSLPMPQNAYVAPLQAAPRPQAQPANNLPLILGGAAGGVVLLLIVVIVAGKMFSVGKTAAVKVDNGQPGMVQKDGVPSIVTPVEKSLGNTESKSMPERIEKAPASETVKPVSAPAASTKAKDWSYGIGAFDQISNRVNLYSPLKHWTGDAWQVSKERPDEESGWIYIDASGGSSGYKQIHSPIRRWTAPQSGKLSVTGELKHFHMERKGDGIRGRLASSRSGLLGEWTLLFSTAKTDVSGIEVQAGDQIDFVVDGGNDWFCDTFTWKVNLRLTDAQGNELGTWNSVADFHGPLPGQTLASTSGPESPAAPALKQPRMPRDPNWKPPGDKGQTKFSTFLGTYSHWDHRDKLYPVVNLQVPANNLWTKEIQQKLQGKIPFEEISYLGRARAYIPIEGVYVVDTHRYAKFNIHSQTVSGNGEVNLPAGYQTVSLDVGSHGGPFVAECSLSMHNKATGEEVQFFNYWENVQKFLATSIDGKSVTEVSGWQPSEENDLRGPAYWWNFDELFKDSAGDPEGRILMRFSGWREGEPRFVPGKVGNAVRFSQPQHYGDTDRYADFPHLSVVFWLRVLEEQGVNPRIASPWVDLNYEKRAGIGVLGTVVDPQRPEVGKWYHYAVTVNQETKQAAIYRDGVQVASGNLGNYESKSNVRWWAFGHNQDGQNHNDTLRGELDEVRIYDRLLSQDEVRQLLAIDLARSANAPITLPPAASPAPTSPPAPTLPLASAKPMLPDPAAVAAARQEVARLFRDDLKEAKTPQAKQELARKMLEIAKATSDRTEKYAMLEEIRKLSEEIKNAALAATVLDLEEAEFGIDALAEKVKLLEKLSGGTMTPVQRGEILSTAMGFGDAALAAGKTESLPGLTAVIRSLASKGVTPDRKTEALDFVESLGERQKQAESLRQAEQKLAASPEDPEANLIVGLNMFFHRMDNHGLVLIAKGNNSKLAAAAKARLHIIPQGKASTVEEANAWYDAVGDAPAEYKGAVQKQALEGFKIVLPTLTGLEKPQNQERHDKLLADRVAALKQSDLPRSTPGMVGRVLVDGKDAGILVTRRTHGELSQEGMASILAKAKVPRARIVFIGTVHCDVAGEFRAFHIGREGGPTQVISMDGKAFSYAGGTHDGGGDHRVNISAGDHVLQWVCDFDLSARPRLDLYFGTPQEAKHTEIATTQRQSFEARRISTKMEVNLSQ